jgi:hypothetical protein
LQIAVAGQDVSAGIQIGNRLALGDILGAHRWVIRRSQESSQDHHQDDHNREDDQPFAQQVIGLHWDALQVLI